MKTHAGWVYVAFIVDVFSRMIVGWQASRSLRADLAIDALEMAVHNRGRTDSLDGLVHHSDRGVQYLSVRYSERLADNDIVASVGSKGDSCDNALVESFHGLYKWELIYPQGPWSGLEDVEWATLSYVDSFNNRRLRRDHRRPQLHHPSGVRGRLLPSNHPDHPGRDPINRASTKPGAVHRELRRANEILKAASAFFGAELDRQSKR